MKKIALIALVLILALSICACGRSNRNETTASTTPSTTMDIIPGIDPTITTNIPDPSVNSTMPMYTDGTDVTDHTGITDNTYPQSGKMN